jgi:hypothetical protein
MDLSKRAPLTPSEKTMVSQTLQIFALDGIAGAVHDMPGRLMFHGGSSIATVHGSPRWSEDLDFVVSPEMSNELDAVREQVEAIAAERIADITPGAKFELIDKGKARGKVREADPGTVMRWTGRWEHPNRHGVVKMKTEFYIAEPDVTARYKTAPALPEAIGIEAYESIPAATLETIWADKIMAMSARPVMKWRDVYDMGFAMERIEGCSDDELFARLEVACESYRSDMSNIYQGLGRDYLVDLSDNFPVFADDMKKWLPAVVHERGIESGQLNQYHEACIEQIDRARRIILDRVPDMTKGEEVDFECGF